MQRFNAKQCQQRQQRQQRQECVHSLELSREQGEGSRNLQHQLDILKVKINKNIYIRIESNIYTP